MIIELRRFQNARLNGVHYTELSGVDEYGFRVVNDDGSPLNQLESDIVSLCKLLIVQGLPSRLVHSKLPNLITWRSDAIHKFMKNYIASSQNKHSTVPDKLEFKSYLDKEALIRYALPYQIMKVGDDYFNVWRLVS